MNSGVSRLILTAALAITGCAPTLTVKQERVYAAFEECKRDRGAVGYELVLVTDEGHFRIRGPAERSAALKECMRQRGYHFRGD